jgi:hypothetical protein
MDSQAAGARRLHWHPIDRTHIMQAIRRNVERFPADRPRMHQHVTIHCDHSTRRTHVRIMHLRNSAMPPSVHIVIIVGDVRDVHDPRVRDVHVAEVAASVTVPGIERLTESQRTPTYATAESEAHSPSRTAEPCNQCRSVNRTHVIRSRRPSPIIVVVNPTAVMERSESPRRVVNPGPSPRADPNPMPVMIRSPSRSDRGHPNWTVRRNFAPHTVVIQIFVTDRVALHVAG